MQVPVYFKMPLCQYKMQFNFSHKKDITWHVPSSQYMQLHTTLFQLYRTDNIMYMLCKPRSTWHMKHASHLLSLTTRHLSLYTTHTVTYAISYTNKRQALQADRHSYTMTLILFLKLVERGKNALSCTGEQGEVPLILVCYIA